MLSPARRALLARVGRKLCIDGSVPAGMATGRPLWSTSWSIGNVGRRFSSTAPLSIAQGAADVPLTQWPSCPSREDVVTRLREPRDELVRRQDPRELTRNRDGARRAVGLGGSPLTLPIYLPREFDLGVIKVGETNVRPRQPK